MQLYFAPNTIAVAPAMAMLEAGVQFDAIKIDFSKDEQTSSAFLKLNLKGRVPVLITPQGSITETGALLEFIADLKPEANLKPLDVFGQAKMRELIHYMAATMHVNHAHKLRGHRWANNQSSFEDMRAKVPETMSASCQFLEEQIKTPFLLGETLSLADCHLFALLQWLPGDGVNIADFPKLSVLKAQINERASFQKLHDLGILA